MKRRCIKCNCKLRTGNHNARCAPCHDKALREILNADTESMNSQQLSNRFKKLLELIGEGRDREALTPEPPSMKEYSRAQIRLIDIVSRLKEKPSEVDAEMRRYGFENMIDLPDDIAREMTKRRRELIAKRRSDDANMSLARCRAKARIAEAVKHMTSDKQAAKRIANRMLDDWIRSNGSTNSTASAQLYIKGSESYKWVSRQIEEKRMEDSNGRVE